MCVWSIYFAFIVIYFFEHLGFWNCADVVVFCFQLITLCDYFYLRRLFLIWATHTTSYRTDIHLLYYRYQIIYSYIKSRVQMIYDICFILKVIKIISVSKIKKKLLLNPPTQYNLLYFHVVVVFRFYNNVWSYWVLANAYRLKKIYIVLAIEDSNYQQGEIGSH